MWAGIYSITECMLIKLRNVEDGPNKIMAGAVTGGVLAIRAGPRVAMKNAIIGGIFLAAIVVGEIMMIRRQKKMDLIQIN
jgi:import inner membrane translocase subunit TIM17